MNDTVQPTEEERDKAIMLWNAVKTQLTTLKEREALLRKQVVSMCFQSAKTGTNRVPLGQGYALKAVIKYNYKVTKNEAVTPPDYSHIPDVLAKLPEHCRAEIIRWSPSLNEALYKKMTADEQKIVNEVLLITDGSSTLDLEPPKQKA